MKQQEENNVAKKIELPVLGQKVFLIDTHCHLDMKDYNKDLENVLDKSYKNGVKSVITIGIDLKSSKKAIALSKTHPMVFATAGIHPHDVANIDKKSLDAMSSLIEKERDSIVAYGEIGLDFVKRYSPIETQKKYFYEQLAIANNFKLPVVVHDRQAHDDILEILKKMGPFDSGGIMHCFSGDIEYAKKILGLGFFISIPGIVTFKNAIDLQQVAREIPLDSLLIETDGPFLAPVPHRGKRNEPLFLLYTAQQIAKLKEIPIDEVAKVTTANAAGIFNFDLQRILKNDSK